MVIKKVHPNQTNQTNKQMDYVWEQNKYLGNLGRNLAVAVAASHGLQ
jgi:hypothetical protein